VQHLDEEAAPLRDTDSFAVATEGTFNLEPADEVNAVEGSLSYVLHQANLPPLALTHSHIAACVSTLTLTVATCTNRTSFSTWVHWPFEWGTIISCLNSSRYKHGFILQDTTSRL
jgi:hypothetical protein